MSRETIWLIDENEHEVRTSLRILRRILPESILIKPIFPPYREKTDYHALLQDPATACIIIDQRLKDTGIANYSGIELANYLRSIDTKVPIYILTNFIDDFHKSQGNTWIVEDVLDKGSFSGDEGRRMEIAARIVRRINVFEDILGEREKRFHELLSKSFDQELSQDELTELRSLQEARMNSVLVDELKQLSALEQELDKYKSILSKLEKKNDHH